MKNYVILKQKHLYTHEQIVMFEGYTQLTKKGEDLILEYMENDQTANVRMHAGENALQIYRTADIISDLRFIMNTMSVGKIESEYGLIEFDIFTHKYIKKENIIVIEYDILHQGEVSDGYQIICTIKEGLHE